MTSSRKDARRRFMANQRLKKLRLYLPPPHFTPDEIIELIDKVQLSPVPAGQEMAPEVVAGNRSRS